MSEGQLNALRERLMAIPPAEVDTSEIPMPTVLQEANDLLTLTRDDNVWTKLIAVGIAPTGRDDLDNAIGACRAAQSRWTVTRDRQKSDAQRKREQQGEVMRADYGLAVGVARTGRWDDLERGWRGRGLAVWVPRTACAQGEWVVRAQGNGDRPLRQGALRQGELRHDSGSLEAWQESEFV